MSEDDIYCCDPRRAKRLLRKMRHAAKTPPPPPEAGAWETYTITLPAATSNVQWSFIDLATAPPAFWRRAARKLVREARHMGLPRYPSQVEHDVEEQDS